MEKLLQRMEEIETSDMDGLLGFAIMKLANDSPYCDIGSSIFSIIKSHPESTEVIEEMLIAITGWDLEGIVIEMEEDNNYYEEL